MRRRFVLDYRGAGEKPAADVARFGSIPGARIIDDTLRRTLIIEGPEEMLMRAFEESRDWVVIPRTVYRNPEVDQPGY